MGKKKLDLFINEGIQKLWMVMSVQSVQLRGTQMENSKEHFNCRE